MTLHDIYQRLLDNGADASPATLEVASGMYWSRKLSELREMNRKLRDAVQPLQIVALSCLLLMVGCATQTAPVTKPSQAPVEWNPPPIPIPTHIEGVEVMPLAFPTKQAVVKKTTEQAASIPIQPPAQARTSKVRFAAYFNGSATIQTAPSPRGPWTDACTHYYYSPTNIVGWASGDPDTFVWNTTNCVEFVRVRMTVKQQ